MGKKVRSAKGDLVDFDFLKIKEQLASAPTPMEVKNRQNFIENRLKRRLKKKTPVVEKAAVEVEPTLPEPAETVVVKVVIDEPTAEEVVAEATKEDSVRTEHSPTRNRFSETTRRKIQDTKTRFNAQDAHR